MRTKFSGEAEVESMRDLVGRNAITALSTTLRRQIGGSLGSQYGGCRDIYAALGYNKSPDFRDFLLKYKHQDIASRVINAPVQSTWRGEVKVEVDGDEWEEFADLADDLKLYGFFNRVDTLSGIGQFALLYVGYDDDDQKTPAKEVKSATNINFVRPYGEGNVEIHEWVNDVTDKRFGQPLTYKLTSENDQDQNRSTTTSGANIKPRVNLLVHWTRVLHIAQGLLEDDVFGTSQLENIYNRLDDLDKVLGGAGEMYWRGAFPGYVMQADSEADIDEDDLKKMSAEMEEYVNTLKRYIRVSGVDIKELKPQVTKPNDHVNSIVDMISAATGIPQRILTGSERGELASTQDQKNWEAIVNERRLDFAQPMIIEQFIDDAIKYGVLKDEDYEVVWPDLSQMDGARTAEIAANRAKALKDYAISGADLFYPPEKFLTQIMGFSKEEVSEMVGEGIAALDDEDADAIAAGAAETEIALSIADKAAERKRLQTATD